MPSLLRRTLAAAGITTVLVLASAPAYATIGAGVSAAPITSAAPVRAGSHVALGGWWVQNTGTQTASYRLSVEPHTTGRQRPLPAVWVGPLPTVTLAPGAHVVVPIRLAVPAGAHGGTYAAYLMATAAVQLPAGGPQAGAAAATDLIGTVAVPGSGRLHSAGEAAAAIAGAALAVVAAHRLRSRPS